LKPPCAKHTAIEYQLGGDVITAINGQPVDGGAYV
jgi:hypothetical protein